MRQQDHINTTLSWWFGLLGVSLVLWALLLSFLVVMLDWKILAVFARWCTILGVVSILIGLVVPNKSKSHEKEKDVSQKYTGVGKPK